MLYTYGVGAQVDLPNISVVIAGLDAWGPPVEVLTEDRLLAAVRRELGDQVKELVAFPWLAGANGPMDDAARIGVPVLPFPRWMRCGACNMLAPIDSGSFTFKPDLFRPERSRFIHENCSRKRRVAPTVVPARFVIACARGHLDEFPWSEYVHNFAPCPNASRGAGLDLVDVGSGTRSTDVVVRCRYCDRTGRLSSVFSASESDNEFVRCRGRRPELRIYETGCKERARPMLLGASNLWFSLYRNAFALPPRAADAIERDVAEVWASFDAITSREILAYAVRSTPALARLQDYDLDKIWEVVERRRAGPAKADDAETDLRRPEWERFVDPNPEPPSSDFELVVHTVPPAYSGRIDRVVAAPRLREVVALVGFARVDMPEHDPADADLQNDPGRVGLTANPPRWVPAVEVRGEGIFLRMPEDRLAAWAASAEPHLRIATMRTAHNRQRSTPWLGARYVLLHSLAHMIINEVALDCGYSAASIRERIYGEEGADPMSGLLLYTASPDAEGTLGGLVSLATPERLGQLISGALERMRICGSDPLCAEHVPEDDETTLHGAACHACLFLPETSCERFNRYLDRNVLVATLADRDLAYFA